MKRRLQAKKSLGQHFLRDENISQKIAEEFLKKNQSKTIVEIGPGTGALTKYLLQRNDVDFFAVETDERMVKHLEQKFSLTTGTIIHHDFLDLDLNTLGVDDFSVIGNFPYNISSQILFKVFENKMMIPLVVGMFQKEVAERIASQHRNKDYGILSVLMQAFYSVEYLFEVAPSCFAPPPKVKSAVIRLMRKENFPVLADEKFFVQLVKAGFNQRRKTLRNSLSRLVNEQGGLKEEIFSHRAEQLSVAEWIALANFLFHSVHS